MTQPYLQVIFHLLQSPVQFGYRIKAEIGNKIIGLIILQLFSISFSEHFAHCLDGCSQGPWSLVRSGVPQGSLVSLSVTHWYPGQPQLAGRWPQADKCSRHKRRKGFHDFPCAGHHQWQSPGRYKAPQLHVPSDKAEHVWLNTHLPAHLNWRTCYTVSTHSIKTQRFTVLCKTNFGKINMGAKNYYMNY